METNYYVYKHTNKVNGKIYIGITCQKPKQRWQNGKGYRENNHFWRSIKKYGWNKGFDHEILYSGLSQRQAEVMEISLIAYYDSTDEKKGYNKSLGGGLQSEETIQKISEAIKGEKNPMYGKTHTEETRQKLSESHKGKHHSEETRQKMSESRKRLYTGKNHPMYGKHHSEESKQKMSESHKGKCVGRKHPNFKPIICITTGCCFNTSKEAADFYNIKSRSNIGSCCRGEMAFSGQLNGEPLVWRYISDLPRPQLTDSDKMHLRDLLDKYSA
jgi:group I intron endonuclease